MKKRRTNTADFYAADLFCGAGGGSSGLLKAAEELGLSIDLLAVNHWDIAIATHSLNHPGVRHVNSDLEKVDPRKVVPGGKLHLLLGAPECTHFSKARGGKPMSKQSRASIKYILRWISVLDVENLIIENVPEFMDWGPLHRTHSDGCSADLHGATLRSGKLKYPLCHFNRPIKNRKGEYFQRFIRKLKEQGYGVKYRVLNAADYGDPTTRKRMFIMARKGGEPIFPEPTHRKVATDMFGTLKTWRPARDIIDWKIKGESIFQRKRPLAENTMRRIMAGIKKFGGKAFVIGQQSGAVARDVDQPLPTVAGAGAISFVEPFIVTTNWTTTNRSQPRSVDEPIPAVTGQGQIGLVKPFIIPFFGENRKQNPRTHSIDEPLPTITSHGAGALVEPFVVMLNGTSDQAIEKSNRSVDEPLPTVTGSPHAGLVEPFIVEFHGGKDAEKRTKSIDEPLPTITTGRNQLYLAEPFIMPVNHSKDDHRAYSMDAPMPTVTSVDAWALVDPFLVEYYGTGSASSVDEPLKTQTSRDRFGLVQPMVFEQDGKKYLLDIRFRMLQPHELASAMSFPKGYKFSGNREQVVKQIGNAIPVELAAALCKQALI